MIALDTNILIYVEATEDRGDRHVAARALVSRLDAAGGIVPMQVLAEFLNVCRRKSILSAQTAAMRASCYMEVFDTPVTTADDLLAGAAIAARYQLAYFDALICAVSRRVGATLLLSEDMADGMEIAGLRIANPFNPSNAAPIEGLLKA
ncbi:MAG: PIN domain-containing protein [Sphingobium sp.]